MLYWKQSYKDVICMDAIVMIHGFMENSAQFDRLAQVLAGPGRACIRVVLPGHETDIREFRRNGRRQWQAHVRQTVGALCQTYDRVLLIGHSMGGLLALDAADVCPVLGVVAVGFPLFARITWRAIRYRAAMLGRARPDDSPEITAVRACCGVDGIRLWNVLSLIPNTIALLQEMAAGRKKLSGRKTPLTVVNSDNDEIVSRRSATFVEKHLPTAKVLRLKCASHFHYPEEELQEIVRCAEAYLRVEAVQ